MTLRERWARTMRFEKVDVLPNMEFGYLQDTMDAWHEQGLPPEVKDEKSAYEYFGIEHWAGAKVNPGGLTPPFKKEILQEDEVYQTYRDACGATCRVRRIKHQSIPQHLDFLLKDRASWEEHFKPRLQPGPHRVAANWAELAREYNQRDYPLCVGIGSMVGVVRNWMGCEGIAIAVHEQPELLEEIVETLCVCVCDTLARVCPTVEFDFGAGWEDICFNAGPIVGYDFMRNVVTPRYKRITGLLHKHGCHIAWTDCDGNILPILDCFMDGGINCAFPVEVRAGSDPLEIRRRYPHALIQGGVNKMNLNRDKEAIREELTRLLPLVKEGGYVPGVDHRVQADVTLENYKYYQKLKREMFGVGGTPQYGREE